MPIVEITGPELPQESKDRIAKAITEIIAVEENSYYPKYSLTSLHALRQSLHTLRQPSLNRMNETFAV
jgi:hypothetical protein